MNANKKVSAELAELALDEIKRQFGFYMDQGFGPQLVWNYEGDLRDYPAAIVWEYGPQEWTYLARQGGTNADGQTWPEAANWPDGIWCEAINHYALALHPTEAGS